MEFLRINRRKILYKFIFSVLIWGTLCGVYYLKLRSNALPANEIAEEMNVMVIVTAILAFLNILVRLFANQYTFYKERRLTRHLLSYDLFDNGIYSKALLHNKVWLVYSQECVFGHIDGFPAIAYVDITVGSNSVTLATFYFFTESSRTHAIRNNPLSVTMKNNNVPENIKELVSAHIAQIKNRGFEKSTISDGTDASKLIKLWG
jgi:hypothetical protein